MTVKIRKVNHELVKSLMAALQQRVDEAQTLLMNSCEARVNLSKILLQTEAKPILFRVWLATVWGDAGEKDVELVGTHLADVIRGAAAKFKEVNSRSDIQARWRIDALLPVTNAESVIIPVPKSFWLNTAKRHGYR